MNPNELTALCYDYLTARNLGHQQKAEETAREMYEFLQNHFEPPPLGVSITETVNTADRMG